MQEPEKSDFENKLNSGEVPVHVESKKGPTAMTVEAIDVEADKLAAAINAIAA